MKCATEIRPLRAAELDAVNGGALPGLFPGYSVEQQQRQETQRMLTEAYRRTHPITLGEPLDLDNVRLYP
jgi:hypothetical protein